jgi:hypothetical protein
MGKFSIEQIYGVSRAEYCMITGISPEEMVRHLEAEIITLQANYEALQQEFINGGSIIEEKQRERVELLVVIYNKIVSKRGKVKDIKRQFSV